jgi:hypothetical protein
MKKNNTLAILSLAIATWTIHPYTMNVSNFTKPRPKTLRRIAKNLSLAVAIESIYTHSAFKPEQQVLLKSIPSFISSKFTPKSIIQLKDGTRLNLEQAVDKLRELEVILQAIIQDSSTQGLSSFKKVAESVNLLRENLEKIK